MRIVSDQEPKPTSEKVLKVIYETPLEHEIFWVDPVWCEKHRCQDPQEFILPTKETERISPKTYGDVMRYFVRRGISRKRTLRDGSRYYEYPDSVFSFLKRINPPEDDRLSEDICSHGTNKIWKDELKNSRKVFLYHTYDR